MVVRAVLVLAGKGGKGENRNRPLSTDEQTIGRISVRGLADGQATHQSAASVWADRP